MLMFAAIVSGAETVALAGAGIWLIAPAVRAGGGGEMGLSSGGFVLAGSLLLAVLTVALYRGRPWCRGPLVAIQLLLLPLGYQFLGGSTTAFGVGLMLAAATLLVLLFLPSSARVLQRRFEPETAEEDPSGAKPGDAA